MPQAGLGAKVGICVGLHRDCLDTYHILRSRSVLDALFSPGAEAAHLVEGDSLGEDEGDSLGEGEGNSLGLQSSGPLSRIKMAKPGLAPKRLSWDCGEYINICGLKGR